MGAALAIRDRLPAAILPEYRREYFKRVEGLRIPAVHCVQPAIYDLVERWYIHVADVIALTAPRNRSLAEVAADVHTLLFEQGYRRRSR